MTEAIARPTLWLVGGSSKLAAVIAAQLTDRYQVVCLCRTPTNFGIHEALDLSDLMAVKERIPALLNRHKPAGIVFCQRYRSLKDFDLDAALATEVLAPQVMLDAMIEQPSLAASVVVISSINALFVNPQIPFWYHWLKSSQVQLVKYYSVKSRGANVRINGVLPGSFLKDSLDSYPEANRLHFENVRNATPTQTCASVKHIAQVVDFLLSESAAHINGELIRMDGGLTNIFQETLVQ